MGGFFSSSDGEEGDGGGGTNTDGGGGTNPAQQACDAITCNGTNRTKKSNSEINAISPTTDPDEYPDTTFRSPCCKWQNLAVSSVRVVDGVDYTDFLNTASTCTIDDSASNITTAINAGVFENYGRKCGAFTLYADPGQGTPSNLLTQVDDVYKFPIHLIHDNPNRHATPSFSCPTRCICPQDLSGEYWNTRTDHWGDGLDGDGFINCRDS
jgi:hypothetical protein